MNDIDFLIHSQAIIMDKGREHECTIACDLCSFRGKENLLMYTIELQKFILSPLWELTFCFFSIEGQPTSPVLCDDVTIACH